MWGSRRRRGIRLLRFRSQRRSRRGGDAPPGFTGKGAREKQQVLDALVQYRDRKGLGSLEALARPGGPTTQELRDALLRRKLPMETWRQIGAALAQDGEG